MHLFGTMLFLAQNPSAPPRSWESWDLKDSLRLITFIGMFIVAVVIGGVLLTFLRRKMIAKESTMAETGSLMNELRRLRKEGVLNEAEYEASRRAATAGIRSTLKNESQQALAKDAATARGTSARTQKPPIRPLENHGPADGLRAKPGFDLTGAPLPPRNQGYEKKPDDKYG